MKNALCRWQAGGIFDSYFFSCTSIQLNNKQQIILTALVIADRTSKPVTAPCPCGLGF
jgi:hypothetical protein